MNLERKARSETKQQFPYATINANYMQYKSTIDLFYWWIPQYVKYKIPCMTQYEYSTSRNNVNMAINSQVPTIKGNLSDVNLCFVAMHFNNIMSDLLNNNLLALTLSIKDLFYI